MAELRRIRESDEDQLLRYRATYDAIGETMHGDGYWQDAENFQVWYDRLEDFRHESTVPEGSVPADTFVLVEDSEIIGMINLRHRLNDYLLSVGGHIGYSIRPDHWGQGYGKLILKLVLEEARLLGIDRVLVTHDLSNPASGRIITANGGVLENQVEEDGEIVCRYWIDLI